MQHHVFNVYLCYVLLCVQRAERGEWKSNKHITKYRTGSMFSEAFDLHPITANNKTIYNTKNTHPVPMSEHS